MTAFALLFVITFLSVAARSYQQLNVVSYRWGPIIPTSYLMQAKEYTVVAFGAVWAVQGDYLSILIGLMVSGTGAWMGCYLGMYLHPAKEEKDSK